MPNRFEFSGAKQMLRLLDAVMAIGSEQTLALAFATARAHIVRFENPLLDGTSESTVYVATKADAR